MKSAILERDLQNFERAADAVRFFEPADYRTQRRRETARRRLIRSMLQKCREFSDDQLSTVVDYLRLLEA